MSIISFLGNGLTAYGPIMALLVSTLPKNPKWITIILTTAYIWTVFPFAASAIWHLVPPLQHFFIASIIMYVLFQELGRICSFLLSQFFIGQKKGPQANIKTIRLRYAFFSGLGFAISYGLVTYVDQLFLSLEDAIIPSVSCPWVDTTLLSAFSTSIHILLQILWNISFFDGLYTKNLFPANMVVLNHLAFELSKLLLGAEVPWGCLYHFAFGILSLLIYSYICVYPLIKIN